MATYDLEEQEQIEELKTWWKLHGTFITAIITALALALAAWQGWSFWQRKQSTEASALYSAMQQAVAAKDAKRARDFAGELIDKYAGTQYAGMAALLSAKAQAEGGDAKTERAQLAWAAEHAKDDILRDLARLRLVALLLDDKAYDEALKQLATEPSAGFAPRHLELKGDVLAAQGKPAEAKAAYAAALAKHDELRKSDGSRPQAYRDMVEAKLEALGSGK
jgi:predicted negative regulator of RcsB-dependent stress response